MNKELNIAGIFIYNGLKKLDQIKEIFDEDETFCFLYNIANGIERLQKILLIVTEEIDIFEVESLKKP